MLPVVEKAGRRSRAGLAHAGTCEVDGEIRAHAVDRQPVREAPLTARGELRERTRGIGDDDAGDDGEHRLHGAAAGSGSASIAWREKPPPVAPSLNAISGDVLWVAR